MTLLIPTFNAVNNSYIEVSEIPPWMPPPSQLPENFRPPEDFKPPEDWQPPPDWAPPEGWEDWEPPEDWEGKLEGQPPPGWDQGDCPPPVVKRPEGANRELRLQQVNNNADWAQTLQFEAPQYMVGIVVNVTYLEWVAAEVRASVDPPADVDFGDEQSDTADGGGLLATQTPPQGPANFNFTWDPRERNDELPPEGTYTIDLFAGDPSGIGDQMRGRVVVETFVVLPCGGAWQ